MAELGGQLYFVGGTGKRGYAGDDGPLSNATLALPAALAFMDDGSFYFSDLGNSILRHVDTDGVVTRVAGKAPVVDTVEGENCHLAPCAFPGFPLGRDPEGLIVHDPHPGKGLRNQHPVP